MKDASRRLLLVAAFYWGMEYGIQIRYEVRTLNCPLVILGSRCCLEFYPPLSPHRNGGKWET